MENETTFSLEKHKELEQPFRQFVLELLFLVENARESTHARGAVRGRWETPIEHQFLLKCDIVPTLQFGVV